MAARNPVAPANEPRPVTIPDALRAHLPLAELSGLVWAPPLDRFLAVVDDSIDLEGSSGRDGDNRRNPFVLALDATGHLDAESVPLEGVSAIDDAEAIAGAPDGTTFFLLTSHSPNKKGKIRRARRQLLQLQLQGRRLHVTGAVDLLQGSDNIVAHLRQLGIPEESPVDLEGLTFHDGALFIGMKAPLLGDGSAVIMRLDQPGQLFAEGKLSPTSLSVWGRVKLSVPAGGAAGDGTAVDEGIADLVFAPAPDGALYLCANAPKGGRRDGGGALWRVARPGGGGMLEANLVHRFLGLKPEGVAVVPRGTSLMLVFDRGSRDPFWTTWPLAGRTATRVAP